MGWVVTAWRTDRLAEWLGEEARAAASAEAERLRAAARDEAAGAAASLEAIERLGVELARTVRAFRTGEAPAPAPEAAATQPTAAPPVSEPAPAPRPRRPTGHSRRGRASLRDSPLGDMMRASAGR